LGTNVINVDKARSENEYSGHRRPEEFGENLASEIRYETL
jgi:hypothetical protein